MDKYKDIEAISMGSSESLVISFHGFQDRQEVKEFAKQKPTHPVSKEKLDDLKGGLKSIADWRRKRRSNK